jgi:hypothetical protein
MQQLGVCHAFKDTPAMRADEPLSKGGKTARISPASSSLAEAS